MSKDVQFANIRDRRFTEAVAGEGVESQQDQVRAGCRSGIADAYVRQNPKMVAKAYAKVETASSGWDQLDAKIAFARQRRCVKSQSLWRITNILIQRNLAYA